MKKQFLLTLITLSIATSAFAEREMSKLQFVETESCDSTELQKTISETANRVMFAETNLTVLEDGLKITKEQKSSGVHASVVKTALRTSAQVHADKVEYAETKASNGQVGVTAPSKFDVYYTVSDADNKSLANGKVEIEVACRIEAKADGTMKHTGSLISFEVKPKVKK